jgi:hypothetical protein
MNFAVTNAGVFRNQDGGDEQRATSNSTIWYVGNAEGMLYFVNGCVLWHRW